MREVRGHDSEVEEEGRVSLVSAIWHDGLYETRPLVGPGVSGVNDKDVGSTGHVRLAPGSSWVPPGWREIELSSPQQGGWLYA